MKRIIFSLLLIGSLLIVNSGVLAQVTTTVSSDMDSTTNLQSNIGGASIGYLKVGTQEVGTLAWHPDFKFGPWEMGADVNVSIGGNAQPSGYENLVLRYVGYDDGNKGLRYGVIDNLTWGHGLLVAGYSTRLASNILLNSDQMAYLGYVDMDSYVVRALTTKRGVYGVRVEERINPMLTLGQTWITDSNGVTPPGTTINQKATGVGLDATMPLPMNFEGYAEVAQLANHGNALGTGISWGQDFMVAVAEFTAGYRFMDSKFVPGYFGPELETNPINLTSAEATGNVKNGWLAQVGVKALGMASLNVRYENYNDSQAGIYADAFAKLPQDIEVTAYYEQPSFVDFRALTFEQGAIIGGSVAYPINPYTQMIVHYKKYYDATTAQIIEDQYYELRLSF